MGFGIQAAPHGETPSTNKIETLWAWGFRRHRARPVAALGGTGSDGGETRQPFGPGRSLRWCMTHAYSARPSVTALKTATQEGQKQRIGGTRQFPRGTRARIAAFAGLHARVRGAKDAVCTKAINAWRWAKGGSNDAESALRDHLCDARAAEVVGIVAVERKRGLV